MDKWTTLNEYSVVKRRLEACRINYPTLDLDLRNENHNIRGNFERKGPAVNRITCTKKIVAPGITGDVVFFAEADITSVELRGRGEAQILPGKKNMLE